jgi:uncharacterized protein YjaZ
MRVKVPTAIDLNGYKVTISYYDKLEEEVCGLCIQDKIKIAISEHKTKEELMSTIFHELLHSILWRSGLVHLLEGSNNSNPEEAIVVGLENHLLGVINLNSSSWVSTIFIDLKESGQ